MIEAGEPQQRSLDPGDENPDLMVGEEVEPEHDLHLPSFQDEDELSDEVPHVE